MIQCSLHPKVMEMLGEPEVNLVSQHGVSLLPSPPLLSLSTDTFWSQTYRFLFFNYFIGNWASLVAQRIKRLPAMWETWVRSPGREVHLEKEIATHSSTLAWKIPWTGPGKSMGLQRAAHDWANFTGNSCNHFKKLIYNFLNPFVCKFCLKLVSAKPFFPEPTPLPQAMGPLLGTLSQHALL